MQPDGSSPAPKRRKRHHEEEHSHPHVHDESNWLVSYADMMTLLFGFFVLMYAFSRVDEEKFQIVRKDVVKYFGGKLVETPGSVLGPNQLKDLKNSTESEEAKGLADTLKSIFDRKAELAFTEPREGDLTNPMEKMEYLIEAEGDKLMFTLGSDLLFAPGSANASAQATAVVEKILSSIKDKKIDLIEVEGHTDPDPISTPQFPSNWELSAARASSIVRIFEQNQFAPDKLQVVGLGSSIPPELTPEMDELTKKKKARRVVINITVSKDQGAVKDALSKEGLDVAIPPKEEVAPQPKPIDAAPRPLSEEEMKARYAEIEAKMEETNRKIKEAQERERKMRELEQLSRKTEAMQKKLLELERKTNQNR